jgi:transposase-like protein
LEEENLRKQWSDKEKARIALEALRDGNTLQQISTKYGVHQSQITQWKKKLIENAVTLFSLKGEQRDNEMEKENEELYKAIGQLKVENDYLKKKYNQMHSWSSGR